MNPPLDRRRRAMLDEMGIPLCPQRRQSVPESPAPAAAVPTTQAAPSATIPPKAVAAPVPAAARPGEFVPEPLPAGIESMDWAALQAAVARCRACALCLGRTRTVFGVGSTDAKWLVVGEGPGYNEDLQGEPFVGQAGMLLDNMLAAIGLSRHAGNGPLPADVAARLPRRPADRPYQAVYISNAVKCRPPDNRNPQAEEVAQCLPWLQRQIALLQPRIILALGRFAVQALLGSQEPIGRLRGRVHHYGAIPLVVSYHPAYLLRAPAEKARAWADLQLAVRAAGQD